MKTVNRILKSIGINFKITLGGLKGWPYFVKDYFVVKRQLKKTKDFKIRKVYPITHERFEVSGKASGHYFHQDLLVARKVYENNPTKHVDIGSRIDGFVAHIATFREIEVLDIRPQKEEVHNIKFIQADLTEIQSGMLDYCDSISSLHAIEHFGLGRYADKIDINGHIKAINSISQILRKKGKFYFSTPIGPQRIEFNAHRVFGLNYLLDVLSEKFDLISFSYIDDKGRLQENVTLTKKDLANNFGCYFGCGVFELSKR